jgi:hypothetical protein
MEGVNDRQGQKTRQVKRDTRKGMIMHQINGWISEGIIKCAIEDGVFTSADGKDFFAIELMSGTRIRKSAPGYPTTSHFYARDHRPFTGIADHLDFMLLQTHRETMHKRFRSTDKRFTP